MNALSSPSPCPTLAEQDYAELGNLLGSICTMGERYDAEKVKSKLRSRAGINSWTVTQLKEVIKFFRSKLRDNWGQNWPQWLSISGRKAQLVDVVMQAVQYRNPTHQNQAASPAAAAQVAYQTNASSYPQRQVGLPPHQQNGYAYPNQFAVAQQHRPLAAIHRNVYGTNHAQCFYNPSTFNQAQTQVEVPDCTEVCNCPEFNDGRSPFYTVEKRYTACPVLPNRRSKFDVQLTKETVDELLTGSKKKALHLRLFDSVNSRHQEWNQFCGVTCQINSVVKTYPFKTNKSGVKKRGYHCVKPLNISAEACLHMEIILFSQHTFTGVCTVELVAIHPVEEIAERVKRRCREEKKCEICGLQNELLRCSRCKSAWYCGVDHQQEDWIVHQKICHPYQPKPKLKRLHSMGDGDDDVVCGESRVSLRCPLTICRIQDPVRGVDCLHPQCLDLKGFLGFSNRTGVWQCPVCTKPLKFDSLVIDEKMMEILDMTDDEVDQVRLFPDGNFSPITLEEIRQEDLKSQQVRASKKRKKNVPERQNDASSNLGVSTLPPATTTTNNHHNGQEVEYATSANEAAVNGSIGSMSGMASGSGQVVGSTINDAIILD